MSFRYRGHGLWRRSNGTFYATWTGRDGSTRKHSLRTKDLQEAQGALVRWVDTHGSMTNEDPHKVRLRTVLNRYWIHQGSVNEDGSPKRSADQNARALDYWVAHFGTKAMTADVTRAELKAFRARLAAEGLARSTIRRVFEIGKAALGRAADMGELTYAPPVELPPPSPPRTWTPSTDEFIAMWNAAEAFRLQMAIMVMSNTLARPEAALELTREQVDLEAGIVHLTPPGREQTTKVRPDVPLTKTLRPWILTVPRGRLITYRGEPVLSLKRLWNETRDRARCEPRFTPKTIRKFMSRQLRRRAVPAWDVSGVMGHGSGHPITETYYAQYDPMYLSRVVAAIDDFWVEVGRAATRPTLPDLRHRRSSVVPMPKPSDRHGLREPGVSLVEPMGVEPTTSTVQTSRSSN
jgi:integrase